MIENLPQSLEDFLSLCNACEKTQEAVLFDILSYAKDTQIGKEFDFETIKDISTFRKKLTTKSWNDFTAYSKRLEHGESDLLFPGAPPFFICTSGTTGAIKYIPESKESMGLKSLTTKLRIEAMSKVAPSIFDGKMLPLVNHAIEGYTDAGIAYGSASGITLRIAPQAIKNKIAFPLLLVDAEYNEWMDYFLMRFALCEDVRSILGNNAGRLAQMFDIVVKEADRIIDDIEYGTLYKMETLSKDLQEQIKGFLHPNPHLAQRLRTQKEKYGKLLPRSYWPNLQIIACWLSGSVGRYKQDLDPFIDKEVIFFDVGYGATEGKFNIPVEPNDKAGILTIYSTFYEFKELGSDTFLLAHELEIDKSYEVFVTTYSGLYRYNMGDIICVDAYIGTTPKIFFEQKSGDILNLCGEKVGASSLIPIVNQAVKNITKKAPHHWCVIADQQNNNYHFCIELANGVAISKEIQNLLEDHLEELLQSETLIYPIFRTQNLIDKLKITLMKKGWQGALYKEILKDAKSSAQTKLPLVYNDIPCKEYIL